MAGCSRSRRPRPGSWRVKTGALAVSLALNLGVLGIVGGAVLAWRRADRPAMMGRDLGFGPFTEALSPATARRCARSSGRSRDHPRQTRRDDGGIREPAVPRCGPNLSTQRRWMPRWRTAEAAWRERLELGQRLLMRRMVRDDARPNAGPLPTGWKDESYVATSATARRRRLSRSAVTSRPPGVIAAHAGRNG